MKLHVDLQSKLARQPLFLTTTMTSSRDPPHDASDQLRTLHSLNAEALRHLEAKQYAAAVAAYARLFTKAKKQNLTHAELYCCYNTCAAALMPLAKYNDALYHAECARKLAEQALKRRGSKLACISCLCHKFYT